MVQELRLYQRYGRGVDGAGIEAEAIVGELDGSQLDSEVRNRLPSTFDGHGAPTFAPTVHGQVEINSIGIEYTAADEYVEVTSAPSLDSGMVSTIAPNQQTWPFWRGLSTFGFTLTNDGYFIYVYRTRDFNQRQSGMTLSRTWASLLEYARETPTFTANAPDHLFPATGETDSVFLGGENHEFVSDAAVAAHIAANQITDAATTPFVWIERNNNPVTQWHLRLAAPGAYSPGVVSVVTRLHWVRQALRDDIPEPATDDEIDAGSSEEPRLTSPAQIARAAGQSRNKKVLDEVDRIPDTFQGALIYLTHDYTEGGKLDFTITTGFNVLDIGGGFTENEAGYDTGRFDGTPFGSVNRNIAPIEVIQGNGTAVEYGVSGFESYNEPFMNSVSMVEINGTQYAVGSVIVSGGIYTLRLVNPPTDLTAATFSFNVLRTDGTWFGTNGDTRIDRAGSYQWDPDATPARYAEGLFGPFQAVALDLPVYAGLLYRVGHRLFAPRTDFVIDAARLPPDGADFSDNWIEATDVTATVGGSTIVTPGEVELPADWALNENGPYQIIEEGRIWVTFLEATTAPFKLNGVEGWLVPPDVGERYRLVVSRATEDGANRQVAETLYTSPYRTVPQVLFADRLTHPDSEIFVIPDAERPEVTSGTVIGIGFERESTTRNVTDVHVGTDLTLSNNVLNTVRVLGGGGYDTFAEGTTGLVVDTTRTARLILDVDILLAAGIESGVPLGIPTPEQARDEMSETAYIWTPERVYQASRAAAPGGFDPQPIGEQHNISLSGLTVSTVELPLVGLYDYILLHFDLSSTIVPGAEFHMMRMADIFLLPVITNGDAAVIQGTTVNALPIHDAGTGNLDIYIARDATHFAIGVSGVATDFGFEVFGIPIAAGRTDTAKGAVWATSSALPTTAGTDAPFSNMITWTISSQGQTAGIGVRAAPNAGDVVPPNVSPADVSTLQIESWVNASQVGETSIGWGLAGGDPTEVLTRLLWFGDNRYIEVELLRNTDDNTHDAYLRFNNHDSGGPPANSEIRIYPAGVF